MFSPRKRAEKAQLNDLNLTIILSIAHETVPSHFGNYVFMKRNFVVQINQKHKFWNSVASSLLARSVQCGGPVEGPAKKFRYL